jgi:HD-like signal output (HDOD) protein
MSSHPHGGRAAELLAALDAQMARKGEMPGFADTIRGIVDVMREGAEMSAAQLADTVLRDMTLTHKVMRLANSPMYAMFGGRVESVSQALRLLGTEAVGHLALGLAVLDQFDHAVHDAAARAEMQRARLAGEIARQLSTLALPQATERAATCGLLHGLGRMLLAFYLPHEWARVGALAHEHSLDETEAAQRCLGLSPTEVGRHVARAWGLPESITGVLHDARSASRLAHPGEAPEQWLASLCTFATRSAQLTPLDAAAGAPPADALEALAHEFAGALGLSAEVLAHTAQRVQAQARLEAQAAAAGPLVQTLSVELAPRQAHDELVQTLADIEMLAGHVNVGQLIERAHQVAHRALGLSRSAVFLRNARERCFAPRFVAGERIEPLQALRYPDEQGQALLARVEAPAPAHPLRVLAAPAFAEAPEALRTLATEAPGCVLAPVYARGAVVALLYGDWHGRAGLPAPSAELLHVLGQLLTALGAAVARSAQAVASRAPGAEPARTAAPIRAGSLG